MIEIGLCKKTGIKSSLRESHLAAACQLTFQKALWQMQSNWTLISEDFNLARNLATTHRLAHLSRESYKWISRHNLWKLWNIKSAVEGECLRVWSRALKLKLEAWNLKLWNDRKREQEAIISILADFINCYSLKNTIISLTRQLLTGLNLISATDHSIETVMKNYSTAKSQFTPIFPYFTIIFYHTCIVMMLLSCVCL